MTTQKDLFAAVRELGLSIRSTVIGYQRSEYRICLKGGTEASAYYTEDRDDALATARSMHKADIISRLKAMCVAKYEEGYDTFVECFDDAEWEKLWTDCGGSETEMRDLMSRLADVWEDRRADARNSAF
jgi:hypothetical protein